MVGAGDGIALDMLSARAMISLRSSAGGEESLRDLAGDGRVEREGRKGQCGSGCGGLGRKREGGGRFACFVQG